MLTTTIPPILALDLIDTLVQRNKAEFSARLAQALMNAGVVLSTGDSYAWFRKRYLEYSLGNYVDDREFCAALAAEYRGLTPDFVRTEIVPIMFDCNRPFDDSLSFLQEAATRTRVVLCSNHVESWALKLIEINGWRTLFDAVIVSSACRYRKPAEGFFRHVLSITGVSAPNQILLIGDSVVNDVYGGSRCGFQTALLARGGKTDQCATPPVFESLASFAECTF